MAAPQSFLLCAPPGLLLLLIGVIISHLPQVQARPSDWCEYQNRKNMAERLEGLKVACVGSQTLPYPVQLPCVGVQPAEWANKTLQQKRSEVAGALLMFKEGVQGVKDQITSQCHIALLKRITDHLAIVNSLQIQDDAWTPSDSAVRTWSWQISLDKVMEAFRNLVKGKLKFLVIDYCKV